MDRYYSGVDIYLGLLERGIKVTGTIISNRLNLPRDNIANLKLKKNESKMFNYKNKLRFLIWQDKKPIYMLTNIYDGIIIIKNKFNYSESEYNIVKMPYMISEYNKYMGGIDRIDHYISTYISNHRSKKWYKKIIVYIINVALSNANILYNLYLEENGLANEKLRALDFRMAILGIYDFKNKDNIINFSTNIPTDPKQPTIKDSFKKITQKNLLLNNY